MAELDRLRESQMQLQMQGIHPEAAVANFPLLTAKMAPKDVAALKKSFPRQGFVAEIAALEGEAKAFAAEFSGKGAATPSQAWKLLHSAKPESILWVAHTSKNAGIQAKFKGFFTEWAQAKQKIPYVLMQEMRIVPDLPDLQRAARQALLRADGQQAGHRRRDEGLPRALLAARSSAARASAPSAHGQEGGQASQEPQEGRRRSGRGSRPKQLPSQLAGEG